MELLGDGLQKVGEIKCVSGLVVFTQTVPGDGSNKVTGCAAGSG